MKLYHFNHNNYGEEYYVMAENKVDAFNFLLTYLRNNVYLANEKIYKSMCSDTLNLWKDVNPEDPSTFPNSFTLDEFDAGHVIESEIA